MKWSAACAKLLSDLWNGRGRFAQLAAARGRVLLVECTVVAVVCGGLYLARYEASARRYRSTLRQTASELQGVALELEAERRELAAAHQRRDLLAGFVLDADAQAHLLSTITDPATYPGLQFVSMSPQPKENLETYARCRAALAMEGSFEAFVYFLRQLESSATPCSVVRIDMVSEMRQRTATAGTDTRAKTGRPVSRTAAGRSSDTTGKDKTGDKSTVVQEPVERISFLIESYAHADAEPPPGGPGRSGGSGR